MDLEYLFNKVTWECNARGMNCDYEYTTMARFVERCGHELAADDGSDFDEIDIYSEDED